MKKVSAIVTVAAVVFSTGIYSQTTPHQFPRIAGYVGIIHPIVTVSSVQPYGILKISIQ